MYGGIVYSVVNLREKKKYVDNFWF
jgi:hypothetical protein